MNKSQNGCGPVGTITCYCLRSPGFNSSSFLSYFQRTCRSIRKEEKEFGKLNDFSKAVIVEVILNGFVKDPMSQLTCLGRLSVE